MTREEAIERMKTMRREHATNPCPDRTAFDMAISALSEEDNRMEWIRIYDTTEVSGNIIARLCGFKCSKCNKQADHLYKFCPNCGRKRGSE